MKVRNVLVFAQVLLILGSIMFNPEIKTGDNINPLLIEPPLKISNKNLVKSLTNESQSLILNIGTSNYVNYDYNCYDPLMTYYGADIQRNSLIYDSLVSYDIQSGVAFPSLAKQWIVSEDSKHWIFHLRDDVYFHDGSKFNSSSVKFTYDRILDPSNPAYIGSGPFDYYDPDNFPLDSVEIISEYVVVIHFFRSYAPFITEEFPIVSPSSFNESGSLVNPIGTGPYMLDLSSSNATFLNFSRFSYHFRGLAPFEEVHFHNFNMGASEFYETILKTGINFLPSEIPQEINSDEEWQVQQINASNGQLMGYFNHRNPVLANRNVRKAINYAINRSYLIDNLFNGSGTPTRSLIPPRTPFADKNLQGFPYNLSYANILLDEAGFIRGSDGYRFSLDLVGITLLTNCTRLLTIISENLKDIGIQTTIDLDYNYNRFNDGEYDIFIFGTGMSDPSCLRDYLHSESSFNTGRYNNSLLDEVLIRGETTPIKQEREYYYSLAQSLIEFDAPVLFINFVVKKYALVKNITNLVYFEKNALLIEFNYTYNFRIPRFKLTKNDELVEYNQNSFTVEYNDFSIPKYAVYFPDADTVLTPIEITPGTVTVKMTNYLRKFILTRTEKGKFISITVSNKNVEYYLRCYYDNDEIMNLTTTRELGLQQWNEKEALWEDLKTVDSNQTLRYIEVKVKGDVILQFGEITKGTFQYLPLAFMLTLVTGGTVLLMVYWNFKRFQQLKERFKL
ncbi:MAG: ABC transporter substrate-binding protein [Candidatus Thorarchaeota archaeon]